MKGCLQRANQDRVRGGWCSSTGPVHDQEGNLGHHAIRLQIDRTSRAIRPVGFEDATDAYAPDDPAETTPGTVSEVGGREHREYWIPAEDLAEFNADLAGRIDVAAEFPS